MGVEIIYDMHVHSPARGPNLARGYILYGPRLPFENVLFMARQPATVAISLFTARWQPHSGVSHGHDPHEPDPSPPQVG